MGYKDPARKVAAYKLWRDKNYIQIRKKRRAYYEANKKQILAKQREKKRAMPRERLLAQRAKDYEKHKAREKIRYHATRTFLPWLNAFRGSKQRAKNRNTPFTLTKDWCETRWTGRCEVTNIEFVLSTKRSPYLFSPSLDQIIPGLGYTPENSRFVLHAVNALKGEGTDLDMLLIAQAIVKQLKSTSQEPISMKPTNGLGAQDIVAADHDALLPDLAERHQ